MCAPSEHRPGVQRDEGRRRARRRVRAGRPAHHHRRRAVDRRLPRRRSLLRDPQPLPAPGWAAVPGADRAVGAVERPGRLPARRRGDAAGLPVARLGVRPRHRASRSWAPASPASRATTSTSSPARSWPGASPAPTSPRRSRSTSRRTTLSSMPSTTQTQAAATEATERAVKLVDADIHPAPLPSYIAERLDEPFRARYERYGVRVANPPQMYPRVRNQGYRVDSWPEGGFPGSDFDLMREQLLDEHKVDYGILIPLHGHSFGAEAPEFAGGAVPRRQRVGPRGDARPRRAPAQHDQHRARDARAGGARRSSATPATRASSRSCCRPRPSTRWATASTGRSTPPPPRPGCRSSSTPAASSSTAARAGRRTTSRSTSSYANAMAAVTTSFLAEGVFAALPRPAGRAASRPASRGPARSCGRWTPRGRPCATTCRTSTAGRPSSSASTSGSRRSRSRSPTIPSSSCRRSSSPA